MSFDIQYREVNSIGNNYLAYKMDLCDSSGSALCNVGASCGRIVSLESFEGQAAESIKLYFSQVHGSLVEQIAALAQVLYTDYFARYQPQYRSGAISETQGDARWPSDAMLAAASKMTAYEHSEVASAVSHVRRAVDMLPGGVSVTVPSSARLKTKLSDEAKLTKKVRDAVKTVDDSGKVLFSSETGEFHALLAAMQATIKACEAIPGGMSSYDDGRFQRIAERKGLVAAATSAKIYTDANEDLAADQARKSINLERDVIKAEAQAALNEKRKWATLGTVAAAIALVAGAVVVVSTLGSGAPAVFVAAEVMLGAIGTLKNADDLAGRAGQLGNLYAGDPLSERARADRRGSFSDSVNVGKDIGKVGLYGAKEYEYRTGKKPGSLHSAHSNEAKFGNWVFDKVGDVAVEYGKTKITDEAGSYLDSAWEVAKGAKGYELDKVLKGAEFGKMDKLAGVAGLVEAGGKAVEAPADYYAGKADEKLEKLNDRDQTLKRLSAAYAGNRTGK